MPARDNRPFYERSTGLSSALAGIRVTKGPLACLTLPNDIFSGGIFTDYHSGSMGETEGGANLGGRATNGFR
jgi:hypothetical protein